MKDPWVPQSERELESQPTNEAKRDGIQNGHRQEMNYSNSLPPTLLHLPQSFSSFTYTLLTENTEGVRSFTLKCTATHYPCLSVQVCRLCDPVV